MPYQAALQEVFDANAITRVAIVDDAFDDVDLGAPDAGAVTAVQGALRDLDEDRQIRGALAAEIETIAGVDLDELATGLRDPVRRAALWNAYGSADPASQFSRLFAPLFAGVGANLLDKLRPLRALKAILEGIKGVVVDEFGSDTEADAVAEHDLLFLDYFLDPGVPEPGVASSKTAERAGRERSIAFLGRLVNARADKLPLVMLISSRASANDLPDFRRATKMLASKMNFLPKELAIADPPRAQHSIAGLVRHTRQADALTQLLKAWTDAVAEASEDMTISIRELDLTDYSYIQHYRLAGEKTPLAQYIAWLFNGRLTDLVEDKLDAKDVAKDVDAFTLNKAIPGRAAPTKAITELFSAVTTTRVPIGYESFNPPAWSGDIFLESALYNKVHGTRKKVKRAAKSYPQVLTVVTPACDLVPDRGIDNPLRTITMISGTLKPLAETDQPSSYLLMLKGKPFVVEWNTKWPLTFPVSAVSPQQGPHDRYQWVGRYRDVYHAELQHRLLQDLGRPALPVPPTMPHRVGLKVLARTTKRPARYETFLEHAADEQLAWTWIGKKGEKMFGLREEMAWAIRDGVIKRIAALNAAEAQDLRAVVDSPDFIDELQLPITFKKSTGELTCGAGLARAVDPGTIGDGTKALVIVFGTGADPDALAAA